MTNEQAEVISKVSDNMKDRFWRIAVLSALLIAGGLYGLISGRNLLPMLVMGIIFLCLLAFLFLVAYRYTLFLYSDRLEIIYRFKKRNGIILFKDITSITEKRTGFTRGGTAQLLSIYSSGRKLITISKDMVNNYDHLKSVLSEFADITHP